MTPNNNQQASLFIKKIQKKIFVTIVFTVLFLLIPQFFLAPEYIYNTLFVSLVLLLVFYLLIHLFIFKPLFYLLEKIATIQQPKEKESLPTKTSIYDDWSFIQLQINQIQENFSNSMEKLDRENNKISTMIESISDSIIAIDQNQRILFANRHFKKNFLSDIQTPLEHLMFWEIIRTPALKEMIETSLEKQSILKLRSLPLKIKRDDKESFFDVTISPLKDSHRSFGSVCVFHDVTEKFRAEKMREEFVANVSHEVRTPLTSIKGHVQLLKQKLAGQSHEVHSLEILERNTDRLTNLFQDILNLSVIESKQKITKSFISTHELIDNVILNVRPAFIDKVINVEKEITNEQIWGDNQLLEQVITNLVENAFKYVDQEGQIIVTCDHDPTKQFTIIEIHDNAIKIPPELRTRIFERFYRLDSGRSREMGGTGLGLAIVKHIIQKHSGKIEVEDSLRLTGNVFKITLPNKKVDQDILIDYI